MAEKDWMTECIRQLILEHSDVLVETGRADTLLITLSFKSKVKPERHVWIDTHGGETGDVFTVDLEDWQYEGSWDNAVVTVDTDSDAVVRDVTRAWLAGESLDAALVCCAGCKIMRK